MTSTLSRRRFVVAGTGAILAAPAIIKSAGAQARTLYVNTWGGSWTAAEEAAFFKPFTEATGIAVRTVAPVSFAKLKAQVRSRNYEFDLMSIGTGEWLRAENEGLAEAIDWNAIDKSKLYPDATFANGFKYCTLGTNLVYRTDKFPNGGPKNWADFWDVKRFPGNRSLYIDPVISLVFALSADGVPRDKIYPMDVDRGFKKLTEIKPHIKVWWTQGTQSQQLLRDGEVDLMAMWNARGSELKNQGVPVEVVWEGADVHTVVWGVAKGAPNAKAAWQFVQFASQAERQAEFAKRLYYGPTNPDAYKYLTPEISRQLPSYPENLAVAVPNDPNWQAANIAAIQERFTQWLAS
jgi:putative spermidine/putrescine transport system substrate-binding protein